MFDYDPPWMPLYLVELAEPVAAQLGVSEVARSPRGFLVAYRLAGGEPTFLGRDPHSNKMWTDVRRRFINRFVRQAKLGKEPWWDQQGNPTRRHLALSMWAYSPDPYKLRTWLRALQ